jgi:signal transduction histidine kinase
MNLGLLNRRTEPQERNRLLDECLDLVELCISETRTLCYLLHPPSLDNCSFTSVLRSYVGGFCHRSDIRVHLQLPAKIPPLPKNVELSLFRTVQEALANIYRHAHTDRVEIALKRDSGYVQLSVRDFGRGIPPERLKFLQQPGMQLGVGIASMRERVHELGGMFEIRAASPGTVVNVWLPIEEMR